MREIKFRGWDKTREEMINVDMLLITENGMQQYRVTRPMVNGCLDVEFVKEDTILMQYIGLNDKNNVEIYKSDLLKDDKGRIFKVIKDNRIGATGYVMECVKNKSEKDHIKIGNIYNFYSWITPFHCLEVIGNIYENPELLN